MKEALMEVLLLLHECSNLSNMNAIILTPSRMVIPYLSGNEALKSHFTITFFVTFDDTLNPSLLIVPYPYPLHSSISSKTLGLERG